MDPEIQSFFHDDTGTFSYLVVDPTTQKAAVIDPVLDYDHNSGNTGTAFADQIAHQIHAAGLDVEWILETHAHADHITAAAYIKEKLGGRIGIGEGIASVQKTFKTIFNLGNEFNTDGSQFDYLFKENDEFQIGNIKAMTMSTPGHTNDSVTYVVGDAAFIGDTLFMPDYGSARCDFPGGSAAKLYHSVQRIFSLPDSTRVFLCHDYVPKDQERNVSGQTTVGKQKASNVHINTHTTEDGFVTLREVRDVQLPMPKLIIPAIQINIRAGNLPPPEDNGVTYLKVPINSLGREN